jgi:hypothetical protein
VVVLAIITLYLGIFPEPFYGWITHASGQIFPWGVP